MQYFITFLPRILHGFAPHWDNTGATFRKAETQPCLHHLLPAALTPPPAGTGRAPQGPQTCSLTAAASTFQFSPRLPPTQWPSQSQLCLLQLPTYSAHPPLRHLGSCGFFMQIPLPPSHSLWSQLQSPPASRVLPRGHWGLLPGGARGAPREAGICRAQHSTNTYGHAPAHAPPPSPRPALYLLCSGRLRANTKHSPSVSHPERCQQHGRCGKGRVPRCVHAPPSGTERAADPTAPGCTLGLDSPPAHSTAHKPQNNCRPSK